MKGGKMAVSCNSVGERKKENDAKNTKYSNNHNAFVEKITSGFEWHNVHVSKMPSAVLTITFA
ncbi:hypothetical protein T09_3750 [Trichinella sp. T9]|nr:hypothetical protein T09_3750 [Trichinella sp. T9]